MENGECQKEFAKGEQSTTIANLDGYPRYRRRMNGVTAKVGCHDVDNAWVVPYNPYLLLKYNCHINVEVCASIKSVKYLYKYVYKGYDSANIVVRDETGNVPHQPDKYNELDTFVETRWVGAAEAAWRIYGLKMHFRSHKIVRLQVHTEDNQTVVFEPDQDLQQCLEAAAQRKTTLTAWFHLNTVAYLLEQEQGIENTVAPLLYGDIPNHYIFKKGKWANRKRKGNKAIGRMYAVNIRDTER
jgi:hypothetical protein